jgi:prepilin signal peptidase PulO-like enzyme (type II secretory pathway)
LAEIAVGAMFLLSAASLASAELVWTPDMLTELFFQWMVIAGMTVVFIYDLRYMLILRSVTWPLVVIGLVGSLLMGVSWISLAIGALVGFGFFWLQMVFSKGRWIGGGDLHLGLVMGLVLGWPKVALALWLAYVVGALLAGLLLLRGKHGWKSQIPFGTFLAASTVFTMIYGERIINWYFGFL